METKKTLAVFKGYKIRRIFDEKTETWFFSVVDVVAALTDSVNPRDYWFKMKIRVKNEDGFEPSTVCRQFKMKSPDGKMRETDATDTEGMLRIIQSIPSPKAEPFKLWLAKVGNERLKDMADPALSLDRAREYWQRQGRSEKWVQQRMMGQETCNKLTDYWKNHEIKGEDEYALLTDLIHREWTDVSVKSHKKMKGLKTQNLRDHMTEAELIFTALAELSTRQIAETVDAVGLEPNKEAGKKGGGIARKARLELESKTGKKVVTGENFLPLTEDFKKLERRVKGTEKKLGKTKGLSKRKGELNQ
jgi:DNA-damage-inducible protein D